MKSFITVLKRAGLKKNSGKANKTTREMCPLLDANFQGAGRKVFSRRPASQWRKVVLDKHELAAFGAQHVVLPGWSWGWICSWLVKMFCLRLSVWQ